MPLHTEQEIHTKAPVVNTQCYVGLTVATAISSRLSDVEWLVEYLRLLKTQSQIQRRNLSNWICNKGVTARKILRENPQAASLPWQQWWRNQDESFRFLTPIDMQEGQVYLLNQANPNRENCTHTQNTNESWSDQAHLSTVDSLFFCCPGTPAWVNFNFPLPWRSCAELVDREFLKKKFRPSHVHANTVRVCMWVMRDPRSLSLPPEVISVFTDASKGQKCV